jgi:hypothetical protein
MTRPLLAGDLVRFRYGVQEYRVISTRPDGWLHLEAIVRDPTDRSVSDWIDPGDVLLVEAKDDR